MKYENYERPNLEELEIVLEGSFLLSGSPTDVNSVPNLKDDKVWDGSEKGIDDPTSVDIWD